MESPSSNDVNYRNVDSSGSTLAADISRLLFLTSLCKQSLTAVCLFVCLNLDCFPTSSDFLKFNYFVLDDEVSNIKFSSFKNTI